ncbi:hypothetical protein PACTADRAFT_184869 [Pachysolen tannophilus NRRL Y-2460]|uniref:General negative regulator of transcription subunit n=1 Tax=Pachysolen tannophilus NRRL Y-2460 TaxID=669874 RepID=A0A1E4U3H0_PACTA|nr:hypothetical protein PACTADRAFT_184869 [Pachysolen tannophilus NRRL Y-2460]
MAHRKLQQEIDRVFKKISEGLEVFDSLYERHGNCTNGSQKEKLEADLKKEIKKLQRFREQIKTWQSTNEIKDKARLLENRRLVEHAMEQYKIVEKGSKQKAYSDQSLMNNKPKELDPEEKERIVAGDFLQNSLDEIERQIEALEAEKDKLQVNSKKGKKSGSNADGERKSEVENFLRVDRFHQEKLEKILRLLENDVLHPQQIMDIKDSIEYFLEANQDPEYYEDDTIYDELNLDASDLVNEVTISLAAAAAEKEEENAVEAGAPTRSKQSSISSPSATKASNGIVSNGGDENVNEPQHPHPGEQSTTMTTSTSASSITSSKLPALGKTPVGRKVSASNAFVSASTITTPVPSATTLKPAPVPVRPAGELSWSEAAAAAAAAVAAAGGVVAGAAPGTSNSLNGGVHTNHEVSNNSSIQATPSPLNKTATINAPSLTPPSTSTTNNDTAPNSSTLSKVALDKTDSESTTAISTAKREETHPQTLSSTIKSATLSVSEPQSQSEAEKLVSEDQSLLILPPGLQDIITSFVSVRKGVNREQPKSINNITTLLRGYRNFSPLPDKVVPQPLESQRAYSAWMEIKSNGTYFESIQAVDDLTLFFIYYYSILPLEKKIVQSVLFQRNWKLHKSKIFWLQEISQPAVFQTHEIGNYKVFDATKWIIQEQPGFQLNYSDFTIGSG